MKKVVAKFFPFPVNVIDVVEVFNAIMLVITGNNLAMADPVMSIISLSLYAAGKKVVEIGNRKMTITPNPDPAGKLPAEPLTDVPTTPAP